MTDDRGPLFDEDFWQRGAGLTEYGGRPFDLTPTLKFAEPEQVASLMGMVRQYVTDAQGQPAILSWLSSPVTFAANEQMREFFAAVKYHPPIVTVTATFPAETRVIEAADHGTFTEDAQVEVKKDLRLGAQRRSSDGAGAGLAAHVRLASGTASPAGESSVRAHERLRDVRHCPRYNLANPRQARALIRRGPLRLLREGCVSPRYFAPVVAHPPAFSQVRMS